MTILAGPFEDARDIRIHLGTGQQWSDRSLALERPIRMNEHRCEHKQSYRHRTQFQNDLHWDLHFSEPPREPCRCADEGWATRQVPEASRSVRGFGGWDYRP